LRRHAAYPLGMDEADQGAAGRGSGEAWGADETVRVTMFVRGMVQGVGFRWWTRARALELGLVGHARNTFDGRVEVVAQGSPDAVAALESLLRESPSTRRRPGHVESVVVQPGVPKDGTVGFVER
jgi:acylphosphatase